MKRGITGEKINKHNLIEGILASIGVQKENEVTECLKDELVKRINAENFYVDEIAEVCYELEFVANLNENGMQRLLSEGKNRYMGKYTYLSIRGVCSKLQHQTNPHAARLEQGILVDPEFYSGIEKWCVFIEEFEGK